MAYLHCHKCGWSQDDFWFPEGYNPFRKDLVDNMKRCLFRGTEFRAKPGYTDLVILEDGVAEDLHLRLEDVSGLSLLRQSTKAQGKNLQVLQVWMDWSS
jgi:hypothetical protein